MFVQMMFVVDYDEVVLIVHQFYIVQIHLFVDEVVQIFPQFDIVQIHLFVDEVVQIFPQFDIDQIHLFADEVVRIFHQFDIVQIHLFVDEVVRIFHQFDIVQIHVFVDEVVFVVQHNYFDYLDHDYYMMMDDYNLQNQNYLFDHYVMNHLVELVDDNHFLRHNIVVDDKHDHHRDLFEMEGCNHLNVIDFDYHHHHHRD